MSIIQKLNELGPETITTIAGVGYQEGISAENAPAGAPQGVIRWPEGDLIVVDMWGHRIWRIDNNGILHTFAGDGVPGCSGDGGPARDARLDSPHDLTQDRDGNLYLSETGSHTIRRIDRDSGIITRVAGSGRIGWGGNGGPATEAELDNDSGVAVDESGNVYICCEWSNVVRKIDVATGKMEHFAGQEARHHLMEQGNSRPFQGPWLSLEGYHGDGGPARDAAFHHPEHLAFDSKGDLYVCDNSNDRIRKINMKTGIITTALGNGQRASNGDGGSASEASILMPDAICFDIHDNMYVAEKYGFRIRKVNAQSGNVSTLVGNGVPGWGEENLPGTQTYCNSPEAGLWADPDGTVFWGESGGRLRKYDGTTGIVTTVLGGSTVHDGGSARKAFLRGPYDVSISPAGDIYIADTYNQRVRAIDAHTGTIRTVAGNGARAYGGDGGDATDAYLGNPNSVAVDSKGRVVIADTRHSHVRRVDEQGIIHNLAGAAFPWDKGDGGPSICANMVYPQSVEINQLDHIYIADGGVGRIRLIDATTGIISTVVGTGIKGYTGDGSLATDARVGSPTSIRFDIRGNLYFSDSMYNVVRMVNAETGIITTVVGSGEDGFSPDGTPALEASLKSPFGVEVSNEGTIYVSDTGNNRVRMVDSAGMIRTVAGSDGGGDFGDGGPATQAKLNYPYGLRLYAGNVLLICDMWNNRLRAVKLA